MPFLVIIIALVFAGRCPRCHKRTLKRVGTEVISRTRNEVVEETTYVCRNCGYVVKRRSSDHSGGGGTGGMIIGGGHGGGFGGGFGGGSFGGGGARGSF